MLLDNTENGFILKSNFELKKAYFLFKIISNRALTNIGSDGGQEVPHLHFHIFAGEKIGKMVS